MSKFIADENFPFPSFRLLRSKGIDIVHVAEHLASVDDETVLNVAKHEDRILLTLDRDHGELIFTRRIQAPRGVVYFRMQDYRPTELGESLMAMIIDGFIFDGYFTVITSKGLRQRRL